MTDASSRILYLLLAPFEKSSNSQGGGGLTIPLLFHHDDLESQNITVGVFNG